MKNLLMTVVIFIISLHSYAKKNKTTFENFELTDQFKQERQNKQSEDSQKS